MIYWITVCFRTTPKVTKQLEPNSKPRAKTHKTCKCKRSDFWKGWWGISWRVSHERNNMTLHKTYLRRDCASGVLFQTGGSRRHCHAIECRYRLIRSPSSIWLTTWPFRTQRFWILQKIATYWVIRPEQNWLAVNGYSRTTYSVHELPAISRSVLFLSSP